MGNKFLAFHRRYFIYVYFLWIWIWCFFFVSGTQGVIECTPQQPPSPLWLTRFTAQPLPLGETARNLRDHVGAPLRYPARNRKRKAETTTTVPVDAEVWLQAAHAANDGEAVTWFTNIHRSQKRTHKECTSKQRRLDNLTLRWEHYLSLYDKLAL